MRAPSLALLVVILLASPVAGQVVRREGGFGDRITGDIHLADELDLYTDRAVAGSVLKLSIVPRGKSSYRAALVLLPESEDSLEESLLEGRDAFVRKKGAGYSFLPFSLPETGRYRIIVGAGIDGEGLPAPGEYVLKTKLRPPRKLSGEGELPGGGGGAEMEFAAVAGSVARIRVKAAKGSVRPDVEDLLDPEGASILDAAATREKRTGWVLARVPLAKFGLYRLRLTSDGPGAWSARIAVRPPSRKARRLDHRDGEPPEPEPVTLHVTSGSAAEPIAVVARQEGGPNTFVAYPDGYAPGLTILGDAGASCGGAAELVYDDEGRPLSYAVRCSGDLGAYEALVSGISREEGGDRLIACRVDTDAPSGAGSSEIGGVVYGADDRVAAWTETRAFDSSGARFDLEYRDVVRDDAGRTRAFAVDVIRIVSGGDPIPIGTFLYPPWALPAD